METQMVVALALGTPVLLLPVAFVGYMSFGGWYSVMKERKRQGESLHQQCQVDSDCPPGWLCQNGVCMPSGK